jgi:hypothetical protein
LDESFQQSKAKRSFIGAFDLKKMAENTKMIYHMSSAQTAW